MSTPKSYLLNLYPNLALTQLAKLWAEADEDFEVEPGKYSAKHHRLKVAADALATAAAASTASDAAASTTADAAAAVAVLEALQPLVDGLTEILEVQENVELMTDIHGNLAAMSAIYTNLSALLDVQADIHSIIGIHTNITELSEIYANLAALIGAAASAQSAIDAAAAAEASAASANTGKDAINDILLAAQQLYLDMATNYLFYPEINALRLRVFNEQAEYQQPLRLIDEALDALQSVPHSLLMLPFASKAGKIYSILPADGSGDLVVSRNSVKTVIGKNGLPVECPVNTLMLDYSTGIAGFLIENAATNLIVSPLNPVTQDIEVAHVGHYLQFRGSGTIVFSGVRSQTVIGNPDGSLKQATISPTAAGTLTLTISGDVSFAQLEVGGYSSFVNGTRAADVVTVPLTGLKSYVWNNYLYFFPAGNPNPYTLPLGLTKKLIFSDHILNESQIGSMGLELEPVDPTTLNVTAGAGTTALSFTVSEMTIVKFNGNTRFYSDWTGLLDESKMWILQPGAARTKYIKLVAGTDTLGIPDKSKITEVAFAYGASATRIHTVAANTFPNATKISIPQYFTLTGNLLPIVTHLIALSVYDGTLHEGLVELSMNQLMGGTFTAQAFPSTLKIFRFWGANSSNIWQFTGEFHEGMELITVGGTAATGITWNNSNPMPSTLTSLVLQATNFIWAYNGALPAGLTSLTAQGAGFRWTYNGALPTGLTYLLIQSTGGNWTYNGPLPTGLTFIQILSNSVYYTYDGPLPTGLTYLYLSGSNLNWTILDVSGTSNLSQFYLQDYRQVKMTNEELITLLTSMTNRVGALPSSCVIGDYANHSNPPQSVVDAIAVLKAAKPNITTVTLVA
ncbi:MAG: hypothetical protein Q8J88_11265 [Bacteroidales bacterium]|nr:hypothetical protein [Bacteroidales bacterium]